MDLETPESLAQVVYDACRLGGKKRRLVTVQDYPWKFISQQLLDYKGTEIMYPVEDDRDRWWARRLEDTVNNHQDLAERDLDGLEAYSLDGVRRVQQKMEKEKCCFCLARNEHNNRCTCGSLPANYVNLCENELHLRMICMINVFTHGIARNLIYA